MAKRRPNGERSFYLPENTAEILRRRKETAKSEWVFTEQANPQIPIPPKKAYRKMKEILNKAELPDIRFDSLGIKYGRVSNWTVNTRAKCRLGQCKIVAGDLFDINISEAVLKDGIDNRMALDVIMHELLHTVKGCFNHGAKWKKYAEYINWKLPQYNIRRVATKSDTALVIERKEPVYKFILRCTKCGQEINRQKESKVITNYKRYRCGKCGGKLDRIL